MSLSDEVIQSARAAYERALEDHERFKWLTDARGLDQLRDFVRAKRKSLNPEMKARLSEFAAWSGLLPADPELASLARQLVEDWNLGPYGACYTMDDNPTSTQALALRYLGQTGTNSGQQRRTLNRGLSTEALDCAALNLRPHCPHAWWVSTYDDAAGSPAERWLLGAMKQIEPLVDERLIRAIIERTPPP